MGKFLKLANSNETVKYYYDEEKEGKIGIEADYLSDGPPEDTDWIVLRANVTKKEANSLIRVAPKKDDDVDGGLRFLEKSFGDLIIDWSLVDEEDKPVKPSLKVYEELDAAAGSWIDRTVGRHLRSVFGNEAKEAEGKLDD